MQLEDTSQQEHGRKQDTCKQLHCVVPFQTDVTKTAKSDVGVRCSDVITNKKGQGRLYDKTQSIVLLCSQN